MKFATVLASLSAASLLLAQPALAATRSADSLPAPGAKVTGVDSRVGSRLGQREDMVGAAMLPIIAVIGALVFLVLVVANEDSFDDVDELPASPG